MKLTKPQRAALTRALYPVGPMNYLGLEKIVAEKAFLAGIAYKSKEVRHPAGRKQRRK